MSYADIPTKSPSVNLLEWLAGYPEAVNALSTALLWALGDVIAQLQERRASRKQQPYLPLTQSESPRSSGASLPEWRFNAIRTLRLATFACFLFAPVTKAWFELLVYLCPGSGFAVAVPRMALDQLLYAPCVITSIFMWTGLLESGGSWSQAVSKWRAQAWGALKANWMLWPAVQLLNQSVVPLQYRMLVAAVVNIPWTAYLASKAAATTVRRDNKHSSRSSSTEAAQHRSHAREAHCLCSLISCVL